MIEVSILITTFNSCRFIRPCLDSIFAQGSRDTEIIVVDNGSSDETVSLIKNNYPTVKLITNKENLGACKGRNQAIEIAQSRWFLILDCDVVLEKDFISTMLACTQKLEENVGMLQPKILVADKTRIYSCGIYLSGFRRFYDIGKGKANDDSFKNPEYIFGVCSAAALYRREMLEDVKEETGYFDERMFFLVEDVDLSWRAQKRGWKALFCPQALCYHYGNSCGFNKKLRQYLCFRNRYYSLKKNEDMIKYSAKILPLLCYDLPRFLYLFFTNWYVFKSITGRVLPTR